MPKKKAAKKSSTRTVRRKGKTGHIARVKSHQRFIPKHYKT